MGCTCAGRDPGCAWGCGRDLRVVSAFVPPWADAAYDSGAAPGAQACEREMPSATCGPACGSRTTPENDGRTL